MPSMVSRAPTSDSNVTVKALPGMQVFRPLDGLAAEVAARSPPLDQWRKFVYCESLTGRVYGEVDHFKVGQHCCSGAACTDVAMPLSSEAAVLLCCCCVHVAL